MIKLQNKINGINLFYMKKKYSNIYNEDSIQKFSYYHFKTIFDQEDINLIKQYNIYIINKYIEKNYDCTIIFLRLFKKIIKRTKVKLFDLDEQELQLLEERIFSNERHIKVLPTILPDGFFYKWEKVRIKFVNSKIFERTMKKLTLINNGELLISNHRIILIGINKKQFFHWKEIDSIKYDELGFEFIYRKKIFLLTIHDSETLNNTIKNFMNKIKNNKKIHR